MTRNEAKKQAEDYKVVPVSREILADIKTPIEVLRALKKVSSHCYMLESVGEQDTWGRYTFLGFDPTMEVTCTNGEIFVNREKIKNMSHPNEMIR